MSVSVTGSRYRTTTDFTGFSALVILLMLGLLTRMAAINHPDSVVFDEVYFGRFVTAYCCTHERFFDVHPPHAKLMIAGFATLAGYQGDLLFEQIGLSYGGTPVWPLRLAPALAGAMLPALVYVMLRQLGASLRGSVLGGTAIVFENALMVQSRMIGPDAIMLSAMFGGLTLYLAARRNPVWFRQVLLAAGAGVLLGVAWGAKLIGLAALCLALMSCMWDWFRGRTMNDSRSALQVAMVMMCVALAVYLAGWRIHFALLKHPGDADDWVVLSGVFSIDVLSYQFAMINAHRGVLDSHPYASYWWQWPLMREPILYWRAGTRQVALLGNPVIWLGSSMLLPVVIYKHIRSWCAYRRKRADLHPRHAAISFAVVGFLICYAPMAFISRTLFMYHYLASLVFVIAAVVLWLDRPAPRQRQDRLGLTWISAGFVTMALLAFVMVLPLTLGLPGNSLTTVLLSAFSRY